MKKTIQEIINEALRFETQKDEYRRFAMNYIKGELSEDERLCFYSFNDKHFGLEYSVVTLYGSLEDCIYVINNDTDTTLIVLDSKMQFEYINKEAVEI